MYFSNATIQYSDQWFGKQSSFLIYLIQKTALTHQCLSCLTITYECPDLHLHNDFLSNSHWLYHFLSDGPSVSRLIRALSPLHHQLREETHIQWTQTHTYLLVTVALEHHRSGQRATLSTAGGGSFFPAHARTCTRADTHTHTNLGLFGVFSCSGVPDGAHVQNLHLLEDKCQPLLGDQKSRTEIKH